MIEAIEMNLLLNICALMNISVMYFTIKRNILHGACVSVEAGYAS